MKCNTGISALSDFRTIAIETTGHLLVDCLQSNHSIQKTNFLKVIVNVIIIDQCNQTARR